MILKRFSKIIANFKVTIPKAEIGIILLACAIPAYILVIMVVNPWAYRLLPSIAFKNIYVLLNVLTISGLIIYIVGRKKFLTRTKNHRIAPVLSLFLGSLLLVLGLYASLASFVLIGYYHHKVVDIGISYSDIFIKEFPSLFWFVLWTISGVILIVDSWKILSAIDQKQQERFST